MPTHRPYAIRPARLDDVASIATVHVSSWQQAYRGLLPADYLESLSVEQRRAQRERWMGEEWRASATLVIVGSNNQIAGFADTGPAKGNDAPHGAGEIYAIYVLEDWWGKGAGRLLFEAATAALVRRGFATLVLWVLETNVRARRFYESARWHADGANKIEDYGTFSLNAVRYRAEEPEPRV